MTPAPLVLKIGGAALEVPEEHPALWAALLALHGAAGSGGLVIVHGGGAAVDRQLAALGMTSERRQGIRITPPEQVEVITAVLAGQMNKQLVGLLQAAGGNPVGLCLGDGGITRCAPASYPDFDPGRVGEVRGGDPRLLHLLLGAGFLPVVSSIGLDDGGERLNINADDAATALASVLGAAGLVLLTDVPAVLDAERRPIPELDATRAEELIAGGVIAGGMIPKVRGALRAAAACAAPVTIASWKDPAALRALAGPDAPGTRCLPPPAPAS